MKSFCEILHISESIRLEPAGIIGGKTCTESAQFEDHDGHQVTIEKGVKVIFPLDALHKHPEYYPEPEKFDPDRFDRDTDTAKKLTAAGVFMSFGYGPRSCLGICCS